MLIRIGVRYASALFDLAKGAGKLYTVAADVDRLAEMISESVDLRRFLYSPLHQRNDQERALAALCERAEIGWMATNFARLIAKNGRLFTLEKAIAAFRDMVAEERGEARVGVVSAEPLSLNQNARLTAELSNRLGKNVYIDGRVDQSLLGGLVVRIGSHQIDGSLKTKLDRLAVAMKGNT